jgi:hypothetical protein
MAAGPDLEWKKKERAASTRGGAARITGKPF